MNSHRLYHKINMALRKKILQFNCLFRPEPEGGYTVIVPSLPGCITYGRDLDEAREMAADAIDGYIASLKTDREPIPSDQETFISSISVPLPLKRSPAYA